MGKVSGSWDTRFFFWMRYPCSHWRITLLLLWYPYPPSPAYPIVFMLALWISLSYRYVAVLRLLVLVSLCAVLRRADQGSFYFVHSLATSLASCLKCYNKPPEGRGLSQKERDYLTSLPAPTPISLPSAMRVSRAALGRLHMQWFYSAGRWSYSLTHIPLFLRRQGLSPLWRKSKYMNWST